MLIDYAQQQPTTLFVKPSHRDFLRQATEIRRRWEPPRFFLEERHRHLFLDETNENLGQGEPPPTRFFVVEINPVIIRGAETDRLLRWEKEAFAFFPFFFSSVIFLSKNTKPIDIKHVYTKTRSFKRLIKPRCLTNYLFSFYF